FLSWLQDLFLVVKREEEGQSTHHVDPFRPSEEVEYAEPLDSNPFDQPTPFGNPFSHPNDSAFSLDSQDTERGVGESQAQASGYGQSHGQSQSGYGQGQSSTDRKKVEEDMSRREADLRRRETELAARERDSGIQRNNWPPSFLPDHEWDVLDFPFVHHDISTLPPIHQTVTKLLYFQWLALVVTLVINLLGCIFLLVSGSSEGGADTAAAGGYLPIIGITSFILWYRPIYLGFSRTEGKAMAFFFYLYFLFAGFHLLFSIYMVIGIPSTGSAGLINTISMLSRHHILAGVFCLLASIGWVLQAAGGGLLYKRVWDYKNGNGDINFQEVSPFRVRLKSARRKSSNVPDTVDDSVPGHKSVQGELHQDARSPSISDVGGDLGRSSDETVRKVVSITWTSSKTRCDEFPLGDEKETA
ncbi:MAG: hypothetical protein TREMPRED_003607, partial [Tremellales sp. Tagirdzhanova-0007]